MAGVSQPASERAFMLVAALVFAASAALTIRCCGAMAAMPGMAMPGGWTMSMAWMPMPGHSWGAAAGSFLGMWAPMMIATMLPALLPMLRRFRRSLGERERLGRLTLLVAVGYFLVWMLPALVAFPAGALLATLAMRAPGLARALPLGAAVVVVLAGLFQFTAGKARHLACCRESCGPGITGPCAGRRAWRHGVRLGVHCSYCCVGPMALLLVTGIMDLGAMLLVTAAITAERVAPRGLQVARALGIAMVGAGVFLLARASAGA